MKAKIYLYLCLMGTLLFLLGIPKEGLAQPLQGTFTIGVAYPTLAAAVTDLNSKGVTGTGVRIMVPAGYTETLSARLNLTATGTVSSPIIFQKFGAGVNPIITAWTGGSATINSATPDGIFSLTGSDYVTIDMINFSENVSNSGASLMEYGIGIFKASASDGASNNTIQNCTITLNRANVTAATSTSLTFHGSHGILQTNATPTAATTALTITLPEGASSNNRYVRDTIQNTNTAIAICGFSATGPTGVGADLNNDIGGTSSSTGNFFFGFGGGSGATAACAAVYLMHQWGFNVSFNTVNNTFGTGAASHPNTQRGIFMNSSSPGASGTINNNSLNITVSGTSANQWCIDFEGAQSGAVAGQVVTIANNSIAATGTALTTTGGFYGIFCTTSATLLNIQNNTFSGFSYGGTNTATNPVSSAIICNTGSNPGTTNITGNLIQTVAATNTGTLNGITNNASSNPNLTISNNRVVGMSSTSTGIINGITNIATATNLTVRDNRVSNITRTGTGTGTSLINGINIGTCTECIIERDTVENIANNNLNHTGNVVCIAGVNSAVNTQFRNNLVRNINVPSTNTVWGIREFGVGGVKRITNNQILNFSTTSGGAGSHTFHGIALNAGTTDTISGNTVYNLVPTGTTNCTVNGISVSTGTTNHVFQNKVSRIGSIGHSTPTLNGIVASAGTTNNINNNLVDSVFATASNSTNSLAGINVSGGTNANVHYNSVLLNGSSTGTNYGSSALSVSTATNLVMNNNVLVNLSPANGTGLRVAFRRSSTTSGTHNGTSGNNIMFAGTPSSSNLIFSDGTNFEQTVAAMSSRLSPAEATTATENVPFQSLSIFNANFLRPSTSTATLLEGRGAVISGITVDADGNARNGSTPDIGAYEFNGIAATMASPTSISFSGQTNTSITVGWTDNSELESSFLVYRSLSSSGPWTLISAVNSTTSTTTGTNYSVVAGGLSGNTTYFFQIIASNGLSSLPLTGSSATAACAGGLSGTLNIPGDFNTIGEAIAQATAVGLTGPVVINLMPTYVSSGETFPITITDAIGCANATNTLTIRPDVSVSTPLDISSSGTQTFLLNGSKYLTIDGRPGGSGSSRMLVLNNTNTSGINVILQNDASFNTITYCDIQGRNSLTSALGGLINFGTANSTFLQGNDNNTISYNLIHSNGVNAAGLLVATGTTTSNAAINDNNQIIGNHFYDYGLSNTASFAVKVDVGNNAWVINDNQVYQTQALNLGTSALTYRAFWLTPNTGSLNNVSGYTISRNTVGGSGPDLTGSWVMSSTGAMTFQAFDISIGLGTASVMSENRITNINFSTSSTNNIAFQGIGIANGQVSVLNNLIGSKTSNSSPYSITFTTSGSLGGFVGIRLGTGNATIQGNTIAGIEIIGNNTNVAPSFTGIQNASGSTTSSILNDTIGSPTLANSILVSSTSATSTSASIIRGIWSSSGSIPVNDNLVANITDNYSASGSQAHVLQGIALTGGSSAQVNGNQIFNLTTSGRTTATTTSAHLAGIVYSTTAAAATLNNNSVYNLNNNNTSLASASVLNGIFFTGSTGTHVIEKNNIHSLSISTTASNSPIINGFDLASGNNQIRNNMIRLGLDGSGNSITAGIAIRGINKGSGNGSVQHNSVYLTGSNVLSSTVNTAAYNRTTSTANDTLRNNILVNNRSNSGGSAKNLSVLLNNSNTIALTSNLYFGTGTGYVFANNGATDFITYVPSWVSGDLNSYFGDPGFINAEGNATNGDLHIVTGTPTLAEGTGELASAIIDDIDNQSRSGLTPVDLGADAGNFTSAACNGVPVSVTAVRSSNTTLCGSGSNTVVLGGGFSALPGYTFQWQQAASQGGPFTDITSATSISYNTGTITSTTFYRCIVSCPSASATVTSSIIDVVINPLPTVSITSPANNSMVCTGAMVRLTAAGNADSTYTWTANNQAGHGTIYVLAQGNTGQSVTSFPSGTSFYTVTARNKTGCTSVAFDTLMVTAAATVPTTLNITSSNLNCTPGASTTLSVNHTGVVGIGTWTYNWTSEDGQTQLQNTPNTGLGTDSYVFNTPTTSGNYRYKVTLTNSHCPQSLAEAVIPVNVGYFADVVTTETNCGNNGSVSIWPKGAHSSYSTWYTNNFNSLLGGGADATFQTGSFTMLSGGLLNLTTNASGLNGMFIVNNPSSINTQGLNINFSLTTTPRTFNFGFFGSDGLAWSYAPNIANSVVTPGGTGTNAENGTGNGIKLAFDAATNSGTNFQGVYLMYNCNSSDQGPLTPGVLAYAPGSFWQGLSNAPVSITISDSGYVTVYINNILVFNNVKLPEAYLSANKSTWRHAFSGRTGGAFQQQSIDNLTIQYPNYEYSVDSVTWQTNRTFSGLSAGSYPAFIRNPADPTCVTRVGNVTVNSGSLPSTLNVIPSVGFNSVVCSGGNTNLTTDFALPGANYAWFTSTNVGGPFAPASGIANASTYTTPNLTNTQYYRVEVTCPSNPTLVSNAFAATVNIGMVTNTNSPQVISCQGGSATLTATPSTNTNLVWYKNATGGSPLGNGNSLVVTPTVFPDTFYVEPVSTAFTNVFLNGGMSNVSNSFGTIANIDGASTRFTTTSSIRIDSIKVFPFSSGTLTVTLALAGSNVPISTYSISIAPSQISNAFPVNLPVNFVVPSSGNYQIFTSGISCYYYTPYTATGYNASYMNLASGAFILNGGATSMTGATSTTIYGSSFSFCISTTCPTPAGSRVMVRVLNNPSAIVSIAANNPSLCIGAVQAISASSATAYSNYSWSPVTDLFLDSAATVPYLIGTHAPTVFVKPSSAFTNRVYTVTASNVGCFNTATNTLTGLALPAVPTGTAGSRCGAGIVTLAAIPAAGSTIDWYDAPTGGTLLLAGSNSFTTPSISSNATYYAEARNTTSGCISTSRVAVNATVNTPALASVSIAATNTSICAGLSVTFTATPVNGGSPTYQWYVNNTPAGTNSATFTSTSLNANDVVRVELTPSICTTPAVANSNSITLTAPAPLVSNPSYINPSTPTSNNGSINLGLSGGSGSNFTFDVYNDLNSALLGYTSSGNSGVFSSIPSGAYRIEVTDPGINAFCPNRVTTYYATLTGPVTEFNGSTWSFGPPTGVTDAIISGINSAPGGFSVRNLTIASGATINNDPESPISVRGNLQNNSTANSPGGTIVFIGGDTSYILGQRFNFGGLIRIETSTTLDGQNKLRLLDGGSLLHGANTPLAGGAFLGELQHQRIGSNSSLRYNYWSSPVANQQILVLGSNDLREFNATTQAWNPSAFGATLPANTIMQAGIGYTATNSGTPLFRGTPNDGPYNVSLVQNPGVDDDWNLVGNPYPSALFGPQFLMQNNSNINGAVYFWSKPFISGSTNTFSGADYEARNLLSGAFSIPTHQGFFVEATNSSLSFRNTQRSEVNDAFFRQSQDIQRAYLALYNTQGDSNSLLVGFTAQATDGYDNLYDARKLEGNPYIAFYSILGNQNLAIQGLAELNQTKIVPLGFRATRTGNFRIGIQQLENVEATTGIMLEDLSNGTMHNLRTGVYNFNLATAGTVNNRFRLHFAPLVTSVQPNPQNENTFQVSGTTTQLVLFPNNQEPLKEVVLMDLGGRMVQQWMNPQTESRMILPIDLREGIYLVRIRKANGSYETRKVSIHP